MAKRELHAKAVQMRKSGMSYSHIKNALQVSKGTLSAWLADYPITEAGSNKLQNADELRIERYRSTRASQRQERKEVAYKLARDEVGFFSERDLFVGGLSLYWGEGGKTQYSSLCMSNTDPAVLVFFKRWMIQLGADPSKFKIRLQLYVDMEPEKETRFWSHALQLPIESFGKPYVKKSKQLNLTYKRRFTHGTCNVMYNNLAIAQRVLLGIEYLQTQFIASNSEM